MNSTTKQARVAGLLYLLVGLSAPFGLVYVPSKLFAPGDATATADHLRASESLLRIGIGSELFHQTIFIFLVLALNRLLKGVDEQQAWLMVILGALRASGIWPAQSLRCFCHPIGISSTRSGWFSCGVNYPWCSGS
jgi:hypothetical protein